MSEMSRGQVIPDEHRDNPISPVQFPDGVTPDVALEALSAELPSSTRRKKIELYQAIIGRGHQRILEMGCARGDLSYALLNNAENVVAIDIEAAQIELAQRRKALWSLNEQQAKKVSFRVMSAIDLKLPDEAFDLGHQYLHDRTPLSARCHDAPKRGPTGAQAGRKISGLVSQSPRPSPRSRLSSQHVVLQRMDGESKAGGISRLSLHSDLPTASGRCPFQSLHGAPHVVGRDKNLVDSSRRAKRFAGRFEIDILKWAVDSKLQKPGG